MGHPAVRGGPVRREAAALTACWMLLGLAGGAPAAEPQSLVDETIEAVTGRVVDLRCELSGDCPAGCGQGGRALGVVTAEGRLVAVVKATVNFAGAVRDLLPFCGQVVELDGLFVGNLGTQLFFVERLRPAGATEWITADRFQSDFAASRPDLPADADFTEHDPRVLERLRQGGPTGER